METEWSITLHRRYSFQTERFLIRSCYFYYIFVFSLRLSLYNVMPRHHPCTHKQRAYLHSYVLHTLHIFKPIRVHQHTDGRSVRPLWFGARLGKKKSLPLLFLYNQELLIIPILNDSHHFTKSNFFLRLFI